MKKLMLIGALALFGSMSAQAGFKLGAHVGLPVGDASDVSSFVAGVDASYLFPVSAEVNLGITSGYNIFFGKDVHGYKFDNLNLVPIAGTLQYRATPEFSISADLGYGFLFADGESDGGFYYQPKVAYHFGPSEDNLGYMGVSKNGYSYSSINLGYAYSFGK